MVRASRSRLGTWGGLVPDWCSSDGRNRARREGDPRSLLLECRGGTAIFSLIAFDCSCGSELGLTDPVRAPQHLTRKRITLRGHCDGMGTFYESGVPERCRILADAGFVRDERHIWRHPDGRAVGEGVMSALIDAAFFRFLGIDPSNRMGQRTKSRRDRPIARKRRSKA